jgi:hypothetical protein
VRFVRLARIAATRPGEAFDRIRGKAGRSRILPDPTLYEPDADWRASLHRMLGADECDPAAFDALWAALREEFPDLASGEDADRNLAGAAWCCARHVAAATIVETGVARGVTSRVLLEAGDAQLWSIDLPGLGEPWASRSRTAVPERLRDRWSYIRGSSRRKLPRLDVGAVDLFVHDSAHTDETVRFELETMWPRLRIGGVMLVDDVQLNPAFHRFVGSHPVDAVVGAKTGDGLFGVLRKR